MDKAERLKAGFELLGLDDTDVEALRAALAHARAEFFRGCSEDHEDVVTGCSLWASRYRSCVRLARLLNPEDLEPILTNEQMEAQRIKRLLERL